MMSDQTEEIAGREPHGWFEHVAANCRPQPAIPAVLAFFLLVLLPMMSASSVADGISTWQLWLITAGVVVSCGLAIAAGFCSLAPPVIWVVFAAWGLSLAGRAGLPVFHTAVIYLGMAVAAVVILIQLWRVRTRRFVPTVIDAE